MKNTAIPLLKEYQDLVINNYILVHLVMNGLNLVGKEEKNNLQQ